MPTIDRITWGKQNDTCMICGTREGWVNDGKFYNAMETHEIARGPHRKKALLCPAAWLRLCLFCHRDKLGTITEQLAVKAAKDPEYYDRVAVNRLRGRADDAISAEDVHAAADRMGLAIPDWLKL